MVKPLTFKGDKPHKSKKRKADPSLPSSTAKKPSSTHPASEYSGANDVVVAADHDEDENPEDQSWVSADVPSDIAGPILLVLASQPPTCIASDAHGNVFASELENLIDGDPGTAEPHDVRQVWVATKVAGVEGWSFKGSHGRYLSSDKHGILSATSSAVSHYETFNVHSAAVPRTFSIQTGTSESEESTFISVAEVASKTTASGVKLEVRGDTGTLSADTNVRVRMQARFKPKIKASKEVKAREKVSRKELEGIVGRRLEEDEVRRLRKARREGDFHEVVLDVRVRGKHDKFA
ncbi:uncharacterized protein BO95DRAFT_406983 [Aspergillus brunneoviolaceus CBS 621.78]|uniref:Uncharacterized protein n=1 Tax=Aspergillus brunneoviolaceus CBS 621.78 TaxID=1450534 RepID=A0ACD1GIG6_9EURO|nr:hypothetical protein BO95DRAFT_406983 [Aspergillus brunneoviolaceus CBS 621.78]RAH49041.1 hypothetical protein BO95DRAFT_406983 [Aspergillus brunneoviolaceus CBS 621.78]